MQHDLKKRGSGLALLPFLIFIVIYLGAGLYLQAKGEDMAFYQFPSVTAMFIAVLAAFCMGRESIDQKFAVFARGAANENVLTMLMIYILAGAFSTVAKTMGGVDATVNLGLSLVPVELLTAGVFVISAFLGTATGTSVGTITLIAPIAVEVAQASAFPVALCVGTVVGGAMFGDNLSFISDTTIAACNGQGCAMKDKFRGNFWIALPAALGTLVIILLMTMGHDTAIAIHEYNLIQILPYVLVLLGGIAGISLVVGGIGIMNIMMVTVTERTREIGIRKAIGASRGNILTQFLMEAVVLCMMGCALGIFLSWAILQIVSTIVASLGIVFYLNPGVVVLAVVFCFFIGIIFGLYPANKAAKMKPIDALHYGG